MPIATPSAALFALAAASLAPASSGAFADPAALDREIARFTGAAIGAPGGAVRPVDRRLRLNPCAGGLALEWHTPRRETLSVRCTDPGGWRLFVPVMATAARSAPGSARVSPIAISRGDPVSLAVSGPGFSVSRPAEALEAGAVGDWIRVRPVTEQRLAQAPVRAQVVRAGAVAISAK
jgi:flagellar basal body P-ring formation protein FlgA